MCVIFSIYVFLSLESYFGFTFTWQLVQIISQHKERQRVRTRERLYQKVNMSNHRYLKNLLAENKLINDISPLPCEVINLPQPEI